jgi:hypothetical protein
MIQPNVRESLVLKDYSRSDVSQGSSMGAGDSRTRMFRVLPTHWARHCENPSKSICLNSRKEEGMVRSSLTEKGKFQDKREKPK